MLISSRRNTSTDTTSMVNSMVPTRRSMKISMVASPSLDRGGAARLKKCRPQRPRSAAAARRSRHPDLVELVIARRMGREVHHLVGGGGEDRAEERLHHDAVVLQDLLDPLHDLAPGLHVERR